MPWGHMAPRWALVLSLGSMGPMTLWNMIPMGPMGPGAPWALGPHGPPWGSMGFPDAPCAPLGRHGAPGPIGGRRVHGHPMSPFPYPHSPAKVEYIRSFDLICMFSVVIFTSFPVHIVHIDLTTMAKSYASIRLGFSCGLEVQGPGMGGVREGLGAWVLGCGVDW